MLWAIKDGKKRVVFSNKLRANYLQIKHFGKIENKLSHLAVFDGERAYFRKCLQIGNGIEGVLRPATENDLL